MAHDLAFTRDSERDAVRYQRLLLALGDATDVVVELQEKSYPDVKVDEVLSELLPNLADAFNTEKAFVALAQCDESGACDRLVLTAVYPPSQEHALAQVLPWTEPLWRLVKEGNPIVIDPLGAPGEQFISGLELFQATSVMLVRLKCFDEVRIIGVCNRCEADPWPFLAIERRAFDSTIELVAIGLRLGERRRREIANIQRVAWAISAELDLEKLLPMVAESAVRTFDAPAASLMLWDTHRDNLTIQAHCGLSDEYIQRQRIPVQKVNEYVARLGGYKASVIDDLWETPFGSRSLIEREGLRSVMVIPLTKESALEGVLCIYSKPELRGFTDNEIELGQIFADHAMVAIQNSRRYQELKQTKGLVGARTALAWTGMINNTWRHAIEGHAITIKAEVAQLRKALVSQNFSGVEGRLNKVERLADKIMERPITPPLSDEEGVERVPINTLVAERMKQLWREDPYRSVKLDLRLEASDAVTVYASPDWLRRAFDIVIDNAVHAMKNMPAPNLTVTTKLIEGDVEICFSDVGPGIPQNVLPRLFQSPIRDSANGLGIGLLMAEVIVQTYGGRIDVKSTDPTGTVMRVSFRL